MVCVCASLFLCVFGIQISWHTSCVYVYYIYVCTREYSRARVCMFVCVYVYVLFFQISYTLYSATRFGITYCDH